MIICNTCKKQKPEEEFPFRDKHTGARNNKCKQCQRAYSKDHYKKNSARYNKLRYARQVRYRERNKAFLMTYLAGKKCEDCGEADPIVLTFDHIRGSKIGDVSTMVGQGFPLKRIKEEILKCEIRCANCHRKRHARENSDYRWAVGIVRE